MHFVIEITKDNNVRHLCGGCLFLFTFIFFIVTPFYLVITNAPKYLLQKDQLVGLVMVIIFRLITLVETSHLEMGLVPKTINWIIY